MIILLLSDLHIDTHDNFSIFRWDENKFIEQIETIREKYKIEKVILNYEFLNETRETIKSKTALKAVM